MSAPHTFNLNVPITGHEQLTVCLGSEPPLPRSNPLSEVDPQQATGSFNLRGETRHLNCGQRTYLPFHDAGSELHDDCLDRVRAGPSPGCQQFHADCSTLHYEALLDAG